MGRIFTRGASALAASAVLGLSLQALPAQAVPEATAGWRLTRVLGSGAANIYPASESPSAIAAPGRDSAWSIWDGCTWPCRSGSPPPVVWHWNGRRWAPVPAGDLHGMTAIAVTASSPKDAWLFGSVPDAEVPGGTIGSAEHWNGTAWNTQTVPNWLIKSSRSSQASVYPADFGRSGMWVFSIGTAFAGHYHNGRWTKVRLPDLPIWADAVSVNDIWVMGQVRPSGASRHVLMHWNGHRWAIIKLPRQRAAGSPGGPIATGPRDLWIPWFPAKAGAPEYLLHRTGGRWSTVRLPGGNEGGPIITDGAGGFWGLGYAGGKEHPVGLFMHWRSGHLITFRVPTGHYQPGNVNELVRIGDTRSLWAIGHIYGRGGGTELNRGAIWRYTP